MTGLIMPLQAQPAAVQPAKAAALDQRIPELMQTAGIPGLSIAIVQQDKIVYERAFGLRSADTAEPVTSRTVFAAASLSKALFAYGLLKWSEQNDFDLDRPLHEYFPYPDLQHDDRYQRLTARQVLSHTTGLPNWRRGDQLNFVRDPGQQFGYSGEGFVYLMRVIEHLSGQELEAFMQEQVFTPLGMSRSSYVWQEDFNSDYAIPHDDFGLTQPLNRPDAGNSAYSLQTTAHDYALFLQAVLQGRGIQAATRQQMLASQVTVAEDHPDVQWGLGVGLQSTPAGSAFWHWGDNGAFKAFCIAFPEQQVGVVYFANSSMGLSVAKELIQAALGGTYPSLNWLDYAGPKAPSRQLLLHILEKGGAPNSWPFMDPNGLHQDTQQIAERPMNRLGYRLLSMGKTQEAVRVLEMNTRAFPYSSNVYDSYGEALLKNGQLAEAAKAYLKAYTMNPENEIAQQIAERIQGGYKSGNTTFELAAYPTAKLVTLAGSFNGWNSISLPMLWENGRWVCRIDLEPGRYLYKFIVDGVWILDPKQAETEYTEHHNSVLEKTK